LAGLVEARNGFPFSLQGEDGSVAGAVNSRRFPAYFNFNLHLEYRFRFRDKRLALRGGFNNITNHKNYTIVNSVVGAPGFLTYYGSEGRHFVVRFRWLGKE
jgi:outer membrane receptor protein involved in Fe transport